MNNIIVFTPIFAVVAYIISHYIHEIGHYISAYFCGLNPRLFYNKLNIPVGVNYHDNNSKLTNNIITISGILLGMIPIIIFKFILNSFMTDFYFVAITLSYLIGCQYDFKDLLNIKYQLSEEEIANLI